MPWNTDLQGTALAIAETDDSPLRVMAGPGTGKSFAMKRRVMRLLEAGVAPNRVLVVTFTRTAAADLVKELRTLGVPGCDDIRVGTLHAFCFSLLSNAAVFQFLNRMARPLVTFATSKVLRFEAAPLLEDIGGHPAFRGTRRKTERIRAFEAAWARLQSEDPGWPEDPVDQIFNAKLGSWLRFHRSMLIGELVPLTLRYLRSNPAAAEHDAFDHVVVDEYQDLNRAEQVLLDILATNGDSVVVGDVDQSIYSFRHAHPEGIVEFADRHPGTHDETLQLCRRCPRQVVRMADSLIRNNHPGLPPGQRLMARPENPDGIVRIVQWQAIEDEIAGLADYVQHLVRDRDVAPSEILVLSPRRLIGYGIRDALRAMEIPTHSFYHEEALEPAEAQERFALLTSLAHPADRVSQRFLLGFGHRTWLAPEYRRLREYCDQNAMSPFEALHAFDNGVPPTQRIDSLRRRYAAIQQALGEVCGLTGTALLNALFPEGQAWSDAMREAAVALVEDGDSADQICDKLRTALTQPELPASGDFVRIMSLHKSKGLTSRVVIITGCSLGMVPFVDRDLSPAEEDAQEREQRRLFYVAITRPTERLVLSSALTIDRRLAFKLGALVRRDGRTYASPFLDELGAAAPNPIRGNDWRAGGFA